jgi:hypothetical protein
MANEALLVFGLLFGLLLTGIVAVDAANRNRSALIWGMATFFTGVLGAFVYALVVLTGDGAESGDPDVVRTCSACGTGHEGTPNYCRECGEPMDDADDRPVATVLRSGSDGYCSNCKSEVGLSADACSDCGALL